MIPPVAPELVDEAVAMAHLAGDLTLRYFRSVDLQVHLKLDGTPVTAADQGAERLLRTEIAGRYPDDEIVGEEEPPSAGTSGRRWIIDPIDGTKAFTRGVPLYTNLVAIEDEHGMAVGVINMPAIGETVYAGRGLGCFCNGAPARVSTRGGLPGSYLSSSGYGSWTDATLLAVKRAGIELRTWGDGYGYALVATGRVDAMFDPVAELYDLAPMPVVVTEAGGRFTDLEGASGPGGGSGLATNGAIHDDLLALLAPAPQDETAG